tara:strand:- start:231 stop:1787 length:1557 start_codon:yes stop_codon:yes gene_type:complete
MSKIKTALISVHDKDKLQTILRVFRKYKIKIISSGGTFKKIKELGYQSIKLSEFTNFPELLDGRVKTLHPKIHAGILSKKDNIKHTKEMKNSGIQKIDLVIVNFYPFEETIKKTNNFNKIIENIDIGGPTLVRAAAKNHDRVTIIYSKNDYEALISELKKNKGSTSLKFRRDMAEKAFLNTAFYDTSISNYFTKLSKNYFPEKKIISGEKIDDLRYGENPHQKAAIYSYSGQDLDIIQLSGKKLSFNNFNDIYSALSISSSLPKNTGTVIVKHSNPCGVSAVKNKLESFNLAFMCDPVSAFGGIVSCNFKINEKIASQINKTFFEIIIGKGFDNKAIKILKRKKNLRLIDSRSFKTNQVIDIKSNFNNFLLQNIDLDSSSNNFKVVSKIKPSKDTLKNLIFTFNVCKHVKSNAIVLSKNYSTVGIGSGQSSRIDSCKISIDKMNKIDNLEKFSKMRRSELCAASDAFFPFVDNLERLSLAGVTAIIQPSGSIRDKEIINFANKLGLVLVFSKKRYFKH